MLWDYDDYKGNGERYVVRQVGKHPYHPFYYIADINHADLNVTSQLCQITFGDRAFGGIFAEKDFAELLAYTANELNLEYRKI